jgi:hypothetical protein
MSRKNPHRPKRLFQEPRLPAEIRRLVDHITKDDPRLRRAMVATLTALMDPGYHDTFRKATPTDQAGLVLAWKNATDDVAQGKACDLCEGKAQTVRFVEARSREDFERAGIEPPSESQGLMGFALVCQACSRLPSAELRPRWLTRIGPCRRKDGRPCGLRPVLIGHRIGEGGELPRRHGLEECSECHETIWINRDEEEAMGKPLLVCRGCAARYAAGEVADKTLDVVPMPWILLS